MGVLGHCLTNIWILYFLCFGSWAQERAYHEIFVGPEMDLKLALEVNPEGPLQGPEARVHFWGHFTVNGKSEPVVGFRARRGRHRYYVFEADGGRFQGRLEPEGPCPGALAFTWTQGGQTQHGRLSGAACY